MEECYGEEDGYPFVINEKRNELKVLDKYIIKKFLGTFFFTIVLFVAVVVVVDLSEKIDEFLEHEAPLRAIVFDYYFNFIPYIGFFLSPIIVFVAVLFFTSRLAARSEIVAILSSGTSFYRVLMVPYLISASVLVLLQLGANHYLVPQANEGRLEFTNQYIGKLYKNSEWHIHMQQDPNTFVYFRNFVRKDSVGRGFALERFEGNEVKEKLMAEMLVWKPESQQWEMRYFRHRIIDRLGEKLIKGERTDTTLGFVPSEFGKKVYLKEAMTTPVLSKFIREGKQKGIGNLEFFELEMYQRTAIPLATFILTILAFALASRKTRGGTGVHLAIGAAICGSYILMMQVSNTFSTNANLSPLVAVMIPNIIYGILALILLRTAPK